MGMSILSLSSTVGGIGRAVGGDLRFVLVADGKQLFLGHDLLAALLEMEFRDARLDDGVHRADFLAEAAVDALEQVDVVARGAAGAVLAHFRIDGDRQRRADRLAQLAGDAALLAVRIAALRVQAAEARRLRRLFLGVIDRDLRLEEVAQRQRQARPEFGQVPGLDPRTQCFHVVTGVLEPANRPSRISTMLMPSTVKPRLIHGQFMTMNRPITTSQKMVTGMNTFQPRRMIWS